MTTAYLAPLTIEGAPTLPKGLTVHAVVMRSDGEAMTVEDLTAAAYVPAKGQRATLKRALAMASTAASYT